MLNATKLGTGTAHNYFKTEFVAPSNSYLTEDGKSVGIWQGKLAEELNLTGPVDEETYHRLIDGQHPHTGEQLIRFRETYLTREGKEASHIPAWDFTMSAPKSWSVAAIVGQDARLLRAAEIANRKALDVAEYYTQARGGGNAPPITARKWIVATFRHDTARPVDGYPAPNLHFHNLIMNLVRTGDRFRSMQTAELYRISSLMTQVFRDELLRQGRALGYDMQVDTTTGAPEIKGFTKEYLDAESLRSANIKAELEKRGFTGARAAQIIARQGREEKLDLPADELRALHQAHGAAFGDQARIAKDEALKRGPVEPKRQVTAEAAVEYARKRLSERSATFEHYQVVRDALRYGNGTVGVQAIENEIRHRLETGNLQKALHIRPTAPQLNYRTPEMVTAERRIIDRVVSTANTVRPILENADLSRYPELADNLPRQQIIRDILATRDQVVALNGTAGSAKSTAAGILKNFAESRGYTVKGLAPTGMARDSLAEKGLKAETLQMHLRRGVEPDAPKTFYIVDEASLSSTVQMLQFLKTLRPKDHVLLIGDDDPNPSKVGQHTSVEAGRIFQELQEAGMKTAHFNKIYRQKDPGLKQAVLHFRFGNTEKGFSLLTKQGRVKEVASKPERYRHLAEWYVQKPAVSAITTPDNQSRQEISAAVHSQMRMANHLKGADVPLNVLASRDMTTVDLTLAVSYRPADVLRFGRDNKKIGMKAGSYATVESVDTENNLLTILNDHGKRITYDPATAPGAGLYEQRPQPFAVGDRVQFTVRSKDLRVSTRDIGTIKSLDRHGNVAVTLDRGKHEVRWNFNQHRHMDYAYAMTSNSLQGKTVERNIWNVEAGDPRVSKLLHKTAAYVGPSRPEYDLQVVTDNMERLVPALSREMEATKALSLEEIQSFRKSVGKEVHFDEYESKERELTPELSLEAS